MPDQQAREANTQLDRPSAREDLESGRDIPGGDGFVADEDINSINDENRDGKPTGQDHSTENYGETMPTGGVGGVQNHSDTTSDIAHIED